VHPHGDLEASPAGPSRASEAIPGIKREADHELLGNGISRHLVDPASKEPERVLVDALLGLQKRGKDQDFRSKLVTLPIGKLYDRYISVERAQKRAQASKK
jgi:hypothetical protein